MIEAEINLQEQRSAFKATLIFTLRATVSIRRTTQRLELVTIKSNSSE